MKFIDNARLMASSLSNLVNNPNVKIAIFFLNMKVSRMIQ